MSKKWKLGERILYNEKAPVQSAFSVCEFLDKNKLSVISHPPYLPDIVLCDSFFPKLKMVLHRRRCNDNVLIHAKLWNTFTSFQTKHFAKCFQW